MCSHEIFHEDRGIFQGKEETCCNFLVFISAEEGFIFTVHNTSVRPMNSTSVIWLQDTSGYCCGLVCDTSIEVLSQILYLKCFHYYYSEVSGDSLNFTFVMI